MLLLAGVVWVYQLPRGLGSFNGLAGVCFFGVCAFGFSVEIL